MSRDFDPKAAELLILAAKGGAPQRSACRIAGIGLSTFYGWLARAQQGEDPYATFARDYQKAQAMAEIEAVAIVRRAFERSHENPFRAADIAMEWLARTRPRDYSVRLVTEDLQCPPEVVEHLMRAIANAIESVVDDPALRVKIARAVEHELVHPEDAGVTAGLPAPDDATDDPPVKKARQPDAPPGVKRLEKAEGNGNATPDDGA